VKILVCTTLFPNPQEPNKGTFLAQRVRHLAALPEVELRIVAPVPWFPDLGVLRRFERWHRFARVPREEHHEGIPVLHPRFLVTPRVGMRWYGRTLEKALLPVLRRLRARFPFDVLDAHYLYPDSFAALRAARRLGLPCVVTARGTDAHTFSRFRAIRPLLARTLREADSVCAVSRALAATLREIVPDLEVTVVPNGVDCARFAPVERSRARERLGLDARGRWLLAVGRLTPVKGHDVLLGAMRRLGERGRRAGLLLVGAGKEREPLERMARREGLNGQVRFVGELRHDELADWYSAADVVCLASHREGWPNVLMEALACGTPVVSTRVGGAPEIVEREELGLLVPPADPDALAAALEAALDRRWDRAAIRGHVEARSWEATARQAHEILQRVVRRMP